MSITLPNVDSLTSDKPLTANSSSFGNAGILVVDEDPAFQLGLKTFLKEYVGFNEVFTARSGAEALQLLETEKSIEIVTLDYQMPGMNGIEVLRRLNAEAPHPLSVVMITGYPSDELEGEFKKLGTAQIHPTHFLSKPVEFEDLEAILISSHDEMKAAERLAASLAEEEAKKSAAVAGSLLGPNGSFRDQTGPISPIAAAAYYAQRDPTEPVPVIETSNPEVSRKLDELSDKVTNVESVLDQIEKRTPSLQKRFWLWILKMITLTVIASFTFVFYKNGGVEKIKTFLENYIPIEIEKPAAEPDEANSETNIEPESETDLPTVEESESNDSLPAPGAPDSESIPAIPEVDPTTDGNA